MSNPDPSEETAVWRIASYRRLWFGTVMMALATQCERLAMGWFVLTETDSVFLTAVTYAVQKAPGSLFAPVAGYISDRVSRSRMLAATALYKAVILCLLALLAMGYLGHFWVVYILVALSGISRCVETPATQGLITKTVPRQMAMRAIAVQSTGSKGVGALGALAGGVVIAALSIPTALFGGAGIFVLSALVMMTMPREVSEERTFEPGVLIESVRGLSQVIRLPVVGTLLLTAFVVETFGFAYGSVLPSVARD
ncbi:MAG: MFS transporter, partial [Candidatus Latescibacteria bacterium]|nr:MFS transporter [Candidatus Latescibacterota bacterium]